MHQCIFDELMMFVLETISSVDYLSQVGIYRSEPLSSTQWAKLVLKINNQDSKRKKIGIIKDGIYPRSFGRGAGVHYYAIRTELGGKIVGNGYKSLGGIKPKYAVGLDAQPDHSHGLCQTFALMFYLHVEDKLKKGNTYLDKIIIGLKFLKEFISANPDNRNLEWSINDIILNMTKVCLQISDKERIQILKKIFIKKSNINLLDIINFLINTKNIKYLEIWLNI